MSSENYWKNWNAQQSAGKGYRPDTSGLTHDQRNEANRIYQEYQKQQEEQRNKNIKAYADLISGASSTSPSSGYSSDAGSYSGEGGGWGSLLIIGLAVFLFYKFDFSCNSSYNYGYSYSTPSTDQLSIASQIMIYPSNKESAVGELKYGITSDSIQWFLKKGKTKTPEKLSWSSARMIYLKNIPSRWVKMYKGKKPVKSGWFLVPQLNNFTYVDTATYRRIREKNFGTDGPRSVKK